MNTTILRRRRVYCPHHRSPRYFQQSIPTTLAALSFSTSLTMLDFSLPRHPLYHQLPIRPSPTYIPGLSCPTSVLLQTFSFLLLLLFYPRSFYILSLFLYPSISLNPDPPRCPCLQRFPYAVPFFFLCLAFTYTIRVKLFFSFSRVNSKHKLGRYVHSTKRVF